jgi:hypothetical protein
MESLTRKMFFCIMEMFVRNTIKIDIPLTYTGCHKDARKAQPILREIAHPLNQSLSHKKEDSIASRSIRMLASTWRRMSPLD